MIYDFLSYTVPTIVASIITWFLSRRKYRAESASNELDNVHKALGIYRETILDLKAELESLREKINMVVEENETLGKKMEELSQELTEARKANRRLIAALNKHNIPKDPDV